jgi:GNAT superfamily N-acetyltransferase
VNFEWVTQELGPDDGGSGFSCGDASLDAFFAQHALQNHHKGLGKTFVWRGRASEGEPHILGFYTLSMSSVLRSRRLQAQVGASLPAFPAPVALLARLAIHNDAQGGGRGRRLVGDALARVVVAEAQVGCLGVLTEAKHERAAQFYARYGFKALEREVWPCPMFLPMKAIRGALAVP